MTDGLRVYDETREAARSSYLTAMQFLWQSPTKPFIVGRHTQGICSALEYGFRRLQAGLSTYLLLVVPFRHGKSDAASRYFPPWAMGQDPDLEIMLASYGASLSQQHSRDSQQIMRSQEYQGLFPGVRIHPKSSAIEEWRLDGHRGKYYATSVGGSPTGKGADILILDDPIRGRKDAESQTIRDTAYHSITDDLMTRLAPVHLVICLGTRWHIDDPIGRLLNRQDPTHEDYVADAPVFEVHHYRAQDPDTGAYLFPERFPEEWYRRQYATLSGYSAAALLDGDPVLRGGDMLKVDRVVYVDEFPAGLLWVRGWDLAMTKDERDPERPDATCGIKAAYREDSEGRPWLYFDDMRHFREEAPKRNSLMQKAAREDGGTVWQAVESGGPQKDAYTTTKDALAGICVVHPTVPREAKVIEYSEILEACFEHGRVLFRKGHWNKRAITECGEVPNGVHDDIPDAMAIAARKARERWKKHGKVGGSGVGTGMVPSKGVAA